MEGGPPPRHPGIPPFEIYTSKDLMPCLIDHARACCPGLWSQCEGRLSCSPILPSPTPSSIPLNPEVASG